MAVARECVHCGQTAIVAPTVDLGDLGQWFGSDYDFCTACGRPWNSTSVDCEHCDTHQEVTP